MPLRLQHYDAIPNKYNETASMTACFTLVISCTIQINKTCSKGASVTLFASQSSFTLLMPHIKINTTMNEVQESLYHFLSQGSLLLLLTKCYECMWNSKI